MTTAERLRTEFMALPRDERVTLARQLLVSLDENSDDDATAIDPEIEAAWVEEAIRRSRAYDAGETTARDWREVVAEIEQKLDQRRSQRDSAEVQP